jgi:hypothetical protein
MVNTFGELKTAIAKEKLGWTPLPHKSDDQKLPRFSLGGDPKGLGEAAKTSAVDFRGLLGPGSHPALALRRLDRGFVDEQAVRRQFNVQKLADLPMPSGGGGSGPAPSGGTAAAVDWRNRWGANWITSVRDQNPCNACWAFSGVALVEAMVRIEDSMWTRLSEGDVHRGIGSMCADYGNMGNVSNFFRDHGICDPGCFPWSTSNPPYTPTPDRGGRTVKGPAFTSVGSVADCEAWIDTVGPLVTWIEVYNDFFGYHSGVYRRSTAASNTLAGTHFMLVVGYDHGRQAWLCKNSWGAGWGDHGYIWVAYGDSGVDRYAKVGVRNVNPDPWTKHRLHNGNLYESGNGAMNRNLEVLGSDGSRVLHRWREGGPPFTWGTAHSFGSDAAVCPTLTGTTFNRNMEAVYLTTGNRLHHWWGPGNGSGWNDGGVFGPPVCRGVPGFIQSDFGAPGNFEVVVLVDHGQLLHLWRDGAGWHEGVRFGSDIAYSGPSLIQSSFGGPNHNLEVVAVCTNGTMQHYWRDGGGWHTGPEFGSGIASTPVMIQGQYGMRDETGPDGNFELCVAKGGRIEHWWRNNSAAGRPWARSATFGSNVLAVAGMCQSQWGMNLEVIALRQDRNLQHYWRDGAGWHDGPIIGPA